MFGSIDCAMFYLHKFLKLFTNEKADGLKSQFDAHKKALLTLNVAGLDFTGANNASRTHDLLITNHMVLNPAKYKEVLNASIYKVSGRNIKIQSPIVSIIVQLELPLKLPLDFRLCHFILRHN